MPKPKHVRPERLLRLLGASYDPFWMAAEEPDRAREFGRAEPRAGHSKQRYRSQPALPARQRNANGDAWELQEAACVLRRWLVGPHFRLGGPGPGVLAPPGTPH